MTRFKLLSFFKIALIIPVLIICCQPSFVSALEATDSAIQITPTTIPIIDSPEANKSAVLRPSFKLENDKPEVTFNKKKPEFKLISGTKFKPKIKVYNHENQEINVEIVQKIDKGDIVYSFDPSTDLPPGEYRINFTDDLGGEINQNFYWGVLAINFNKSVYNPLENSYLSFAVLDETGDMVCDAKLSLTVEKPDGTTDILSTEDGRIKVNPECLVHGYTEKPDYEAEYSFGENLGTYKFHLTAETKNGSYSIDDQVQVSENIPIEVDRIMATRIFPPKPYTAVINLKANQDFHGVVEESVPIDFIITKSQKTGTKTFDKVIENIDTKTKKIQWNLDLTSGNEITLNYKYNIPDVSPELYFVGPMKFTDSSGTVTFFEEKRQWQMAVDAVSKVTIRQEINIIDGLITGGTDPAIINLDTTKYGVGTSYFFEVIAKVSSGTLTANLSTGNTNTVGIGISNTGYVRVRQVFTPETGSFDYHLNLVNGTSPQVKAARIIILQTGDNITATQTQIEIGDLEVGLTMAASAPLNSPKYWKYDSSLWDGTLTFSVDVTYKAGVGTTGSQTFVTAGNNTFTAPTGITSVNAEVWGGGAAGGGQNTSTDGGGGGGGGAYSNKYNIPVTGGVGYTAFVGVGGTGKASSNGGNGASSYFISAATVMAVGGSGGSPSTGTPPDGGKGGLAASGVGDTKWNGGQGEVGRNNSTGQGGYGGSSAGTGTTGFSGPQGANWSTVTYPTASTPDGAGHGGNGGAAAANGAAPASGNGGGGGGSGDGTAKVGGAGAAGKVIVSWAAINNAVTIYLQEDNGSFSGWANVLTVLSGGTDTTATHIGVTGFTPNNGRNYRLVASTNGVAFNIYNAKIIVNQTSATAITKLQPQYLLLNTKSTSVGATLGYGTYWDSTEWSRTTNVYKHAMDAIGAGASSALVDVNNSNVGVSYSSVVGSTQVISNGLTMPVTGHQIDTWLYNAGTEVDASRILVQVTVGVQPAEDTQASFRWSNDTEGETHTSSWLAAENVGITGVAKNTNLRVRFSVSNIGGSESPALRLQVAPLGAAVGCTDVASENFIDVPTTVGVGTSVAVMTTSSTITDQEATTHQLTDSSTTFVAGKMVEYSSNTANSITLAHENFTEVEYVFQFTSNAADSAAYCFRTANGATALQNYTNVASVTTALGKLPTVYPFQRKTWYDGSEYWESFNDNGQMEFWYSVNGTTWTENTNARISVNTNDFSIEGDSGNAFVAYTNGYDIEARKAGSVGVGFSWSNATVVYNGVSTTDTYSYPTIARDANNKVFVSARHYGTAASPYLYILKDKKYEFLSDFIPEATSPDREYTSFSDITQTETMDGRIKLKITEELDETAYINQIYLRTDKGEKINPSLVSNLKGAYCVSPDILLNSDSQYLIMNKGDEYELEFPAPKDYSKLEFGARGYFIKENKALDFVKGEDTNTSWEKKFVYDHPDYQNLPVVKRDENAIHFLKPDGKVEAQFLGGPINYQDENGNYKGIDTAIGTSPDSNYDYANIENQFKTYFSKDVFSGKENIKLKKDNTSVTIKTLGSLKVSQLDEQGKETGTKSLFLEDLKPKSEAETKEKEGIVDPKEKNKITYPNFYTDGNNKIDVSYIVRENKVQEQLILNQYQGFPELTQEITLNNAYAKKEGRQIIIYNSQTDEPVWYLLEPKIFEKNDETKVNFGLDYDLKCKDNQKIGNCTNLILTKVLNQEGKDWFSDPKRQYPVVIDPDFLEDTADGIAIGYNSTYSIAQSTAFYGPDNTQPYLQVGQRYQTAGPVYSTVRPFLKFDTRSIAAEASISQVNMSLVNIRKDSPWAADYDVQIVKSSWSSQDPLTSGNMDAAYDNCLSGTADDSIWLNTAGIGATNTQYASGNLSTAWPTKGGYTYYCLRSSRDKNSTTPTGLELIDLASQNNATVGYRPILTIAYTEGTTYQFKSIQSTTANSISSWETGVTLDDSAEDNKYGAIVPVGVGSSANMYAVWIDGTTIEGKKYVGVGTTGWEVSADSIGTGMTGMTNSLSLASDTVGNAHLIYIDVNGSAVYREYTSSWQTAVTLDSNAGNEYPGVAVDEAGNNGVYAFWTRSDDIFYKRACSAYSSWGTIQTLENTGVNDWLTVGAKDFNSGKIFAEWTLGESSPYTFSWSSITPTTCTVTSTGPTLIQLLRHGAWFNNGVKQPFTF